tara:strand:- start:811 stop:1284 length:474 start_codon:yes stop_codon:yes gene_type:complete
MPNSCNSITKNLCIALLVSSCASTQNYQTSTSLNGKFLVSNGSDSIPFNVSLQSNSNIDIIQIKKPFYGNVLRAEIDKSTAEILNLKSIDDLKQFEMKDVKILSSQIIKMFYRCLINHSQIQYWNDGSFKAQCSNTEEKILLKIETDIWTISGFIKL